jgi:NAD(P)-dependent dehydrogenase (short-subunit alcohol dehydrogenase family)/aryl carrier-like protein
MKLENDLGLDSIKKVEILALLAESYPQLTKLDQAKLTEALTLGDWEDFFAKAVKVANAPASVGAGIAANFKPAASKPVSAPKADAKTLLDQAINSQAINTQSRNTQSRNAQATNAQAISAQAINVPSGIAQSGNSQGQPTLWQVEPVPFSPDGHGVCMWPPTGLIRLVGSDAFSKSLEKELANIGYEVERRSWRYDFKKWNDPSRQPRVLILVWPGPDRNPELITQALEALENSGDKLESIVGLSFLGGFFGFPRAATNSRATGNSISGALVGLLKCAAREWPSVNIRVLDLPLVVYEVPTKTWIKAVTETMTTPGPVELGLPTSDSVFSLSLKPYHPLESKEPLIEKGDTVVVTGGGRGVTAAVCLELARLYRPRLVILGRTPIPPPEPDWLRGLEKDGDIKQALHNLSGRSSTPKELEARSKLILSSRELGRNLAALAAAGAKVEYISGDFTKSEVIEDAARQIRTRFGPICGFIHGAGVLADHPIKGKSQADFARVYATKTQLASLMLEAFQPEPLRFMVFFSSSTARFGRQGQGDYAAGNEVLNKTAWEMATLHPNCRVLAVNWGPWAGGMVTDALAGQFKSQGVGLIGLKEGTDAFLKLIKSPVGGPAEVLVLGPGTRLDLLADTSGRER